MDRYMQSPNPRRLYRSRDRVISGVCGGLADHLGWDPTVVRVITGVLLFSPIGAVVFVGYLILWFIAPVRPFQPRSVGPEEEVFWRNVSERPAETFSSLKYRFRDLDNRLAGMERVVTSEEWRLKRQFKDLEGGA